MGNEFEVRAGLTLNEVYKKYPNQVEKFNSIDKDGDDRLNQDEVNRYNGPLMNIKGQDFYPGLKLATCTQEAKNVFSEMDVLERDEVISKEEFYRYQTQLNYEQQLEHLKRRIASIQSDMGRTQSNIDNVNRIINEVSTTKHMLGCSLPGLLGGLLGAGSLKHSIVFGAFTSLIGIFSANARRKELREDLNISLDAKATKEQLIADLQQQITDLKAEHAKEMAKYNKEQVAEK